MAKRNDIHKVLIIGSGPIIIGQACEFDYSGTQACKALRNLGYEIVLVNSNPATIMTDPEIADVTYIEPLNVDRIEQIIKKERPDALLPNLGGQSGLNLCSELAQAGVLCDASVRPLHCAKTGADGVAAGPDHFDAPSDPYWVPVEGKHIFEVPLTVTPLLRPLPKMLRALPDGPDSWGRAVRASLRHWGALALLPVEHPLWAMRAVTSLFAARGGRVLSLTWHSSEMLPGGAPHLPDAASVERLMTKIEIYLDWLHAHWEVRCLTMDGLRRELGSSAACPRSDVACDWTTGAEQEKESGQGGTTWGSDRGEPA